MLRGPKPRLARTCLASELLVAWMRRSNVSQRQLAYYLDWSLTRVSRVLNGQVELSVSEAVALEDLTKGEVFVRSWTYQPTGVTFRSGKHESVVKEAH